MTGPTVEEAVRALRAAAHEEVLDDDTREARTLIHTVTHVPGLALGADWDLADAVEYVEAAVRLAWVRHPIGHDLEARSPAGRLVYFRVLQVAAA